MHLTIVITLLTLLAGCNIAPQSSRALAPILFKPTPTTISNTPAIDSTTTTLEIVPTTVLTTSTTTTLVTAPSTTLASSTTTTIAPVPTTTETTIVTTVPTTTLSVLLPAPTNSTVTLNANKAVVLTFTPIAGALKYRVARSSVSETGPYDLFAWVDPNMLTSGGSIQWPSGLFREGLAYYFKISTLNSAGQAGPETEPIGPITIPYSLGCSIETSKSSVTFGESVNLIMTTTGNPNATSINGTPLTVQGGSIRYTPKLGGINSVSGVVSKSGNSQTCLVNITTTPPPIPATAQCTPYYKPFDAGPYGVWLGADVGLSLNLAPNRTLSLFGDTFLNSQGNFSRSGSQMVGNTISISSCVNGVYTPSYHWWGLPRKASAFFPYSEPSFNRYWTTGQPWLANKFLYIPVFAIQNEGDVGFRNLRTDVAIISNPNDPPWLWNVRYSRLFDISSFDSPTSQGSSNFWGGIYSVVFGDYIYFYNNSGNDLTVSRIKLDSLALDSLNPSALLEYFAKDGNWKANYSDADAKRMGIPANAGLSVRYNFKLNKWMMVSLDTTVWLSNEIKLRTAPSLTGPWSAPVAIYKIPEVTQGSPIYNAQNLCYQAFEHMAYNPDPDNQMAITYACNSFDMNYVVSNMNLYFPKFLRVTIPSSVK